ncbi:MAG: phosphatidylglycerophosphate synthase, partial [Myxococcota bacterium]
AGLQVHTRNQRVAKCLGLRVVTLAELPSLDPNASIVVVPATSVITRRLLEVLPETASQSAWCLGDDGGQGVMLTRVGHLADPGKLSMAAIDEPTVDLGPDCVFDASTPNARGRTTKRLLRLTQKPTDGVVSRHINRPISRLFSRFFLALGLSANHASVLCLAIGLVCAALCAMTGPLTLMFAGLLFQFASVFDGVDGEMARVTLTESPRGAWIDTAIDNFTFVACLAGVVVGWLREGPGPAGVALGVTLLIAVPMTLAVLLRFVHRHGPDGSLVFIDRVVAQASDDAQTTALRVARVLFHGLRRDVFALALCLVCMLGSRAAIPAAVLAGLTVAVTVFVTHWSELTAAAQKLGQLVSRPTPS